MSVALETQALSGVLSKELRQVIRAVCVAIGKKREIVIENGRVVVLGRGISDRSEICEWAEIEAPITGSGRVGVYAAATRFLFSASRVESDGDVLVIDEGRWRTGTPQPFAIKRGHGTALRLWGADIASLHSLLTVTLTDDSRAPALTEPWLSTVEGKTIAYATDSYRMLRVPLDVPGGLNDHGVPAFALRLAAALGATSLVLHKRSAGPDSDSLWQPFTVQGAVTVRGRARVYTRHPEAEKLIPSPTRSATASRADLLALCRKAAQLAQSEGWGLTPLRVVPAPGRLALSLKTHAVEWATSIDAEHDLLDDEVAFNPRYLASILAVLQGEKVTLRIDGNSKPAAIAGDGDLLGLLMPVRTS